MSTLSDVNKTLKTNILPIKYSWPWEWVHKIIKSMKCGQCQVNPIRKMYVPYKKA